MKRIITLILAAALLLLPSCAAEAEATPGNTTPTPTTPAPTTPAVTLPTYAETDNPVSFLSISLHDTADNPRSITAYVTESGEVHVEYVGEVTKVAELPINVIHGITAAWEACGLAAFRGQSVNASPDGGMIASLYVTCKDGAYYTADFIGMIPEAYREGYRALDAFFAELTAHLPVYVPVPIPLDDVDERYLNELIAIFSAGGITEQDAFTVDSSLGTRLADRTPIASSAHCGPLMMTTPYSLTIVTLRAGADVDDVCRDFAENLDWNRLVCVQFDKALIAVKDDMVLCLMAAGSLYTQTAQGIESTGWRTVRTLRP